MHLSILNLPTSRMSNFQFICVVFATLSIIYRQKSSKMSYFTLPISTSKENSPRIVSMLMLIGFVTGILETSYLDMYKRTGKQPCNIYKYICIYILRNTNTNTNGMN